MLDEGISLLTMLLFKLLKGEQFLFFALLGLMLAVLGLIIIFDYHFVV